MYHQVTVLGNLGNDPSLREVNGTPVSGFSLAANKRFKGSDGQWQDQTVWFRVSAWGPLANIVDKYLKKGRKVFVVGELSPDTQTGGPKVWAGKDGEVRASYDLLAKEIKFVDQSGGRPADNQGGEEDEIPF